jgi:hypothetical protein
VTTNDIYDDPDLVEPEDEGTDFPPTVKFRDHGDRVKGRVTAIEKFPAIEKNKKDSLKYVLADAVMSQSGVQSKHPAVEVIAGSKNLKGQLMVQKPRPGDTVDITFVESKPNSSGFGNPTKIFTILIERAVGAAQSGPDSEDEEDLFS